MISAKSRGKQCRWAGYPLIIYFALCHSRGKSSAWFAARNPNPAHSTPWLAGHSSAREGPPICFPLYQVGEPEAPASREVGECGFPGSQAPLSILVEENQMKEMHSYCVLKDNSHRPRTSDSIYTKPQVSTTELWWHFNVLIHFNTKCNDNDVGNSLPFLITLQHISVDLMCVSDCMLGIDMMCIRFYYDIKPLNLYKPVILSMKKISCYGVTVTMESFKESGNKSTRVHTSSSKFYLIFSSTLVREV